MKVLLIYPPYFLEKGLGAMMKAPPLALLQLAAMIPNHEVEILDLNVIPSIDFDIIEEKISKFDMVGITCMSNMLNSALKLCELAKRHDVTTVLGGFHPTLKPDVIEYPNIDYTVRGEGEYTFKELVDGLNPSEILGLSYKKNGEFHHNKPRPFITNLDELPYPRKDLVDYKPYITFGLPGDIVETSRGCPFDCHFCCVSKFYGRTYRKKSPLRVIKELELVPKTQFQVFFTDDNFMLDHKRVEEICYLIREHKLHRRFMFSCQARVDDTAKNPELVNKMAESKFFVFFIGFESLKQESLDIIKKQVSLTLYKKAIKNCHDNKILVFGSFIIGNIGETREDILKMPKLVKELKVAIAIAIPLTPLPGTRLMEQAVANGWIAKDFDWTNFDYSRPIMRTPDLTIEEITELKDHFFKSFYKVDLLDGMFKKLNIKPLDH
ncbi:MAG: cobalamin B12-binding domain-containing protein [Candidatus Helarchaeota archaeon]|nr:cobalamin B12-binding domain-containing protein [Candidatus Helarchaeota archaeon]